MPDLIRRLAPYRLEAATLSPAARGFAVAIEDCRFNRTPVVDKVLATHRKVAGLYLWLLSLNDERYKVYVGHTTDLEYRLKNYISDFQPHAPNDYKLRIFHGFIREQAPTATFEFFVKPIVGTPHRSELHAAENAEIAAWAPLLLNKKGKASAAAKATLERAFDGFYRSSFESLLAE